MRNIIVGTAGHIDHGKTELVRKLTGIETDRLAEEKRRGISIELGFASLELGPELRIGFIDVPGHERFVKNMLAGAGGIDMVLLVIAADESVMPQTREHFDICRLLGIRKGIVALTKTDLVDEDLTDLVRLEVEEFVEGSFLENAPVIPVSAVTGDGIEELRAAISSVAAEVQAKDTSRHFRLPIDRAFSMRGFGTVITGTLVSGAVRIEDEVEVHPAGDRLRVRGVQVHGREAKRALAGQRTALNLAGPAATIVQRGMTLSHPGLFQATKTVECLFELLPSAKPLKNRAPVHFHAGTAEVIAEARLLEADDAIPPGGKAFVRFLLREPVLLLPGDRFIARMFSPVLTIGGGAVLETAPPPRIRRAKAVERLNVLQDGAPAERIGLLVTEGGYGLGVDALVSRTGMIEDDVIKAGKEKPFLMFSDPRPWLADREKFESLVKDLRVNLRDYHRANPLKPGMPKEDLRSQTVPGAPPFYLDELLKAGHGLVAEGDLVRLASHRVNLKQDEEKALQQIESAFERAGLKVPATKEVLAESGVEPSRARNLLQILLRDSRLIKVGDELVYHHSAIESLKVVMAQHKGERFKVPQFKDWTGISRKYAIPLLEYLDRQRITVRQGDERVVV